MVFSLRTLVLVLLWSVIITTKVKAELEVTIYAFRNSNDLTHKTYSYDVVPSENLNTVSSINLLQSGPDGQMTSLFTRGTNSNHTLITYNGIPIKDNSTPLGTDDISQHSFLGINSLEVIKGPMSSVYGPNAVGGTINMVSQPNTENSIDVSYGSNNTKQTTIKLGEYYGNTIVDLSLQKETSNGISVADGDEDDGYNNTNYHLQISNGAHNFKKMQTHNKVDLDGRVDTIDYTSSWKFDNNYYSWQPNKDTEITVNNANHKRKYDKSGVQDNYKNTTNTILGKHTLHNKKSSYTFGTEHEFTNVKFDTAILGYVSNVNKDRTNNGYFFSIDNTTEHNVQLHTGVRIDTPNTFDNQVTYRVGAEKNGVRLSYATGYKAPTVYEMYGVDNYGFLGNTNLVPEETQTYEIGYRNQNVDLAFFKTTIDNLLKYEGNTYINDTKKSDRHGVELGLTQEIGDVTIQNNTTFTIAEDGDGNELLRRPKWMNTLSANYKVVSLQVNYFGEHLDLDYQTFGTVSMPSVTTVDLSTEFEKGGLTFYGKLSNITNVDYERPDGYNQYGRNFTIGFKKTF